VLDDVERFYLAMVTGAAAPRAASGRALLLELGRVYARSVDSHFDHARIWLDWSTAVGDALWQRYLAVNRRIERLVARIIRRGQRDGSVAADVIAEDAARLFVAASYAVVQMKVTRAPDATVERFLASAVRAVAGHPGSARRGSAGAASVRSRGAPSRPR
ncbi:MAG TPA: hypothetical protein VNO26_06460, partial [Candidatus Limnocylindria bacterium]|nr:hypothetical protein [Candidatus Limnocylindria bacterium]